MLRRRTFRITSLLAAFALVASACADDPDAGPEPDDALDDAGEADDEVEDTEDIDEDDTEEDAEAADDGDRTFPEGTVEIQVGAGPGSTMDFLARGFQPHLEEKWDVDVVVTNNGGANQSNAYNDVAAAEPDGHTLLIGVGNTFGIHTDQGTVDVPSPEFGWFGNLIVEPYTWFVSADSGIESIDDFVDSAPVAYGDGGVDSPIHPFAVDFFDAHGMDFTFTPGYDPGEVSSLVQTGEQDAVGRGPAFFERLDQSDEVTPIVVASDDPHPALPDVPTFGELADDGMTELEPAPIYELNFLVGATPGTPDDVLEQLAEDFRDLIENNEEIAQWMEENLLETDMLPENIGVDVTQDLVDELQQNITDADFDNLIDRL